MMECHIKNKDVSPLSLISTVIVYNKTKKIFYLSHMKMHGSLILMKFSNSRLEASRSSMSYYPGHCE